MFDNRWDNWAGDFTESFAAGSFDTPTRDRIPEILRHFGDFTRRVDANFPDDVSPNTFASVFAQDLPRLTLAPSIRDDIPEVVARFFEFLQEGGRLGEGYAWAEQVRRFKVPSIPKGPPKPVEKGTTIRKTTQGTVGRNDPCPCGSGKKYKKCCYA